MHRGEGRGGIEGWDGMGLGIGGLGLVYGILGYLVL